MAPRKHIMLTDRQIIELVLSLLGMAATATIVTLLVYFLYIRPNVFYGDLVALSVTDSAGTLKWLQNSLSTPTFTTDQEYASVFRLVPGLSGRRGQILQGDSTTFEIRHMRTGSFLASLCETLNETSSVIFSTTTGTQFGASEENHTEKDGINPVTANGIYQLHITELDCGGIDCGISTACDVSGCFLGLSDSNESLLVDCNANGGTHVNWGFHKVLNTELYNETRSAPDSEFTT